MNNSGSECKCTQAAAQNRAAAANHKTAAANHTATAANHKIAAANHTATAEQLEQTRRNVDAIQGFNSSQGPSFEGMPREDFYRTSLSGISFAPTPDHLIHWGDWHIVQGDSLLNVSPQEAQALYQMAELLYSCARKPELFQAGVYANVRPLMPAPVVNAATYEVPVPHAALMPDVVSAPADVHGCPGCTRANTTCAGCSKGPAVSNNGSARCSDCPKA